MQLWPEQILDQSKMTRYYPQRQLDLMLLYFIISNKDDSSPQQQLGLIPKQVRVGLSYMNPHFF